MGFSRGGLRNPIRHSVCASWLALDGHLELLLPTIDASHLVWVPGWSTEVLACLQACELCRGAGGVNSLEEPGLQRHHYSGTWENCLTSGNLSPLIGCF